MIEIKVNERAWDMPQMWNECDTKQAMNLIGIATRGDDDYDALRIEMLIVLCPGIWDYIPDIEASELYEVLPYLDGFFEMEESEDDDAPIRYRVSPTLTRCPVNVFELKGKRKLVTLADSFDEMNFHEWCAVNDLYTNYLNAKTANEIRASAGHIMAVLYRPPGDDQALPDPRRGLMKYEHMVLQRKAHFIQHTPDVLMKLLMFWVASCRAAIIREYPIVFNSPVGKKGENPWGWQGVLLTIADGPQQSRLEDAGHTNVHNVMVWLDLQERNRAKK